MKNIFKNKLQFKVLFCLSFIIFLSCDTDETQTVATLNNLVWADEFDTNGTPDSGKWNLLTGDGTAQGIPGWGNNELQTYTDRSDNVTVQNGVLIITAKEEDFQGKSYTSARITTKGKLDQQYGRFEARIKLPTGKGIFPAFWLLGDDNNGSLVWPQIGEIDIMEFLGDEPTTVFGTIHGPNYSGANSITKKYEIQNDRFDTGFHVFGVEWTPNQINWYVDGDLYQSITPADVSEETDGTGEWVFNRPFHIILNVAVGGNLPGSPNAETDFPQRMLVDYVRVYN
ncbi:glycoside hydrolase family 16 protein [Polaribacter porphyrae]|uniref:Glycosyl hydrolase family 16 n=1 Tax=Polaribacter porphyrae TaxID=1137780 RepID=A0A2S7WM81_9FLAO|nr:glycoside hydrolase family 16 protein [Polaribacter porphyrae]PQJ78710.1 glycosyl hydrolase family 16 [Polaribacter porphyrae]